MGGCSYSGVSQPDMVAHCRSMHFWQHFWWVISVIIMWLIFAGVIACTASCCVYGIASFIEKHFFVKKPKRKMPSRQIDRVLEIYDEIDNLFDSDSGRSSRTGTEITRLSATDEDMT